MNAVFRHVQTTNRLASVDLTSARWVPLLRMREQGKATVADLARCANTDAGAMTRLLDRLVKKGLLSARAFAG